MTTALSSGAIYGTLNGSDASEPFTPSQHQGFVVHLALSADAVGTVTVKRSTDGVSFVPNMAGARVISARSSSGYLCFIEPSAGTTWRLEAALSSGKASHEIRESSAPPQSEYWTTGSFAKPGGTSTKWFLDQKYGFTLQATIASADAMLAITQSVDGGATWTTYQAATNTSFTTLILPGPSPAMYRLECTMTVGSVTWQASNDFPEDGTGFQSFNPVLPNLYGMTPAQLQQLYALKWTPLSDADLAGNLTLYKACAGNAFAKLSVPAAAKRCKGPLFGLGSNREIRAEYADAVSVVDASGNALSSARSGLDPTTVYAPGSRVIAKDLNAQVAGVLPSLGEFTSSHFWAGIYGYVTLLEAATMHINLSSPLPNLAALGL